MRFFYCRITPLHEKLFTYYSGYKIVVNPRSCQDLVDEENEYCAEHGTCMDECGCHHCQPDVPETLVRRPVFVPYSQLVQELRLIVYLR